MILHSDREGNDCIRKLRCHCIQILHSDIYSVWFDSRWDVLRKSNKTVVTRKWQVKYTKLLLDLYFMNNHVLNWIKHFQIEISVHKLRWQVFGFFWSPTLFIDSFYLIKIDIFELPTYPPFLVTLVFERPLSVSGIFVGFLYFSTPYFFHL